MCPNATLVDGIHTVCTNSCMLANSNLLFCFQDDPEDLPFKKGDRMTLLSKEEDGWWLAGHSDGRKGLVPVPYITVVSL